LLSHAGQFNASADVINSGNGSLRVIAKLRHQPLNLQPGRRLHAGQRGVVAGTGWVASFPVEKVIDTVGAGDGFAVGVNSGLLDGLSVPDACKRGA
jgi:sugar/nucleoside kinase (ribokinase family)